MTLRECPFCGRKTINRAEGVSAGNAYRQCLCNTCGAEGKKFYYGCYPYEAKTWADAQNEADDAWNTRPTPAQPDRAEVESVSLIAAISAGFKEARQAFMREPEDFMGDLSDCDFVAFIYPRVFAALKLRPLTPAEREEAVRVMAGAIEEAINDNFGGEFAPSYEPEERQNMVANAALTALESKGYVGRKR